MPPRPSAASINWRSTKLALALTGMALVSAAYALAGEGFSEALFDEFCWALEGFVAIYVGGNVWQKRALGPGSSK